MIDCSGLCLLHLPISQALPFLTLVVFKLSRCLSVLPVSFTPQPSKMRLPHNPLILLAVLLPQVHPLPLDSQFPISSSDPPTQEPFKIPSRYTSTLLARRLLALSPTGVLSTIFPPSSSTNTSSSSSSPPSTPHDANALLSSPPSTVASTPIALPDYVADCEGTGNPTLLALSVSTSTRNAVAGSNVSLALSWWDSYRHLTHRAPWSAANLPRASLIGYLEQMSTAEIEAGDVVACYTGVHRDSRLWLPGDSRSPHEGVWMRMVVQEVYWIGGFGDRNFIGWFDLVEWRGIQRKDWEEVRLPGEK